MIHALLDAGRRHRLAARGRAAALSAAGALMVAIAMGTAGCGGDVQTTARIAAVTPAATPQPPATSATSAATASPGSVAVAYTNALFAGHFVRAGALVDEASRNALNVVELGLRSSSVHARGLHAGATTVSGADASVVLLGTLCSSHTDARASKASGADCITNHDPKATNPIFHVDLTRSAAGQWRVAYRMPG